ncbi:MAG: hypothetical protein M1818_007777 [Claussenomyces sp. TS43310]|nr:MAG: hypothetical protein M1818_007777 [Claussenomyces sp. TS43310]
MSFRRIQPFADSISSSNGGSSQYASGSRSSDTKAAGSSNDGITCLSRRRQPPKHITRNACTNCRRARAKCDGKVSCTRCQSRAEEESCAYETPRKRGKHQLVGQIVELEKELEALRAEISTKEQILRAVAEYEHPATILGRLKNNETYDSIVRWLARKSSQEDMLRLVKESQRPLLKSVSSAFRWTSVIGETSILDYLFQLYFAWVHPAHTLFSEGHFVDNYMNQSSHFCSSTLVNAICAMACHLHTSSSDDTVDFDHLGTMFSDAARASISTTDKSLTTVQASAIMFLVDCARGDCLRASSYLKAATDNISNIVSDDRSGFFQVLQETNRGVHCLNVEWAQMTFQATSSAPFLGIDLGDFTTDLDQGHWYFYRYIDDECPAWPGLMSTVNREKAKLALIIYDALILLYGVTITEIHACDILHLYWRYVNWRKRLPVLIGDIESSTNQALPHVLSLLILYSTSIVQLLRPLLDLKGFPNEFVEGVVWKHAQEGLFLLSQHYETRYTCRYQPVLQIFAILHLCDVIAPRYPTKRDTIPKEPDAIQSGIQCTMQSQQAFPIAGPLVGILRRLATECSIHIPTPINDAMLLPAIYEIDDVIGSGTRPSYSQPIADIQARYSSGIAAEWAVEAPTFCLMELTPTAG